MLKSQQQQQKYQTNRRMFLLAIETHKHKEEPSFKIKSLYLLDRAIDQCVQLNFYQVYNNLTFYVEIKDVFRVSRNCNPNKSNIEEFIANYYQYLLVKAQIFYSSDIIVEVKDTETFKKMKMMQIFTEIENIQRILQKIWDLADCCPQLPSYYLKQGLMIQLLTWVLRNLLQFIRTLCQIFSIVPYKIDEMNKRDLQQLISHLKFYNEQIVGNLLKFLKNNQHIQAFRQISCTQVSRVDINLLKVLSDYASNFNPFTKDSQILSIQDLYQFQHLPRKKIQQTVKINNYSCFEQYQNGYHDNQPTFEEQAQTNDEVLQSPICLTNSITSIKAYRSACLIRSKQPTNHKKSTKTKKHITFLILN